MKTRRHLKRSFENRCVISENQLDCRRRSRWVKRCNLPRWIRDSWPSDLVMYPSSQVAPSHLRQRGARGSQIEWLNVHYFLGHIRLLFWITPDFPGFYTFWRFHICPQDEDPHTSCFCPKKSPTFSGGDDPGDVVRDFDFYGCFPKWVKRWKYRKIPKKNGWGGYIPQFFRKHPIYLMLLAGAWRVFPAMIVEGVTTKPLMKFTK